MKNNRIIWCIVSLIVLITVAVSFGTRGGYSQQKVSEEQKKLYGDSSKYSIAEYDAPASKNEAEREERVIKSKRYDDEDNFLTISKKPHPETVKRDITHAEPMPAAIPFDESSLVIIGEVISSKAFISNNKRGVYSEYLVRVNTILKQKSQKPLQPGEIVSMDRAGGVVQYPNGQRVLYKHDWHDFPELNGRYVFFLNENNDQSPNYKLLTGYHLKENKVKALDFHSSFYKFNEMSETDFLNRIKNIK